MEPKTYFVLMHLVGLVVGLGSVTTLDVYLLRFLRGDTVTPTDAHLVGLVSKLAAFGLLLLWLSGAGFLILALTTNPHLLASPKVHAKLIVVGILTINGAVLHFKVLPQVERAVGGPLFCRSGRRSDRIWMRVCGGVSAASWWTPFALGAIRELNFAASTWVFLTAYVGALAMALLGFTIVEHYLSTHWNTSRQSETVAPAPARAASVQPVELSPLLLTATQDDRFVRTIETRRVPEEWKSFRSFDDEVEDGEVERRLDEARGGSVDDGDDDRTLRS